MTDEQREYCRDAGMDALEKGYANLEAENAALRTALAEARKDTARLDWCERTAAAHPELEKHGLVPMTRAAIGAAIQETEPTGTCTCPIEDWRDVPAGRCLVCGKETSK